MKLLKILGMMPQKKMTGKKYRVYTALGFESDAERKDIYRKAGLPETYTDFNVYGYVYLTADNMLMQEPYISIIGNRRGENGKRLEVNVKTSKLWSGAIPGVRKYLEDRHAIARTEE